MHLYEAMFLIDNGKAKDGLTDVRQEIAEAVQRQEGELVNCEKWEERKLAYPVKRQKRGTYVLAHFNAPPDAIARLERAFQLSGSVLRVLITVDEDGPEVVAPRQDRGEFQRGRQGSRPPRRDRPQERTDAPEPAETAPADRSHPAT